MSDNTNKGELLQKIVQLQSERNELAAAVDALRDALKCLLNDIGGGSKFCGHEFSCVCAGDKARAALKATPQQHLRDVRADTVTECQLIVARVTTTCRENPGMGFSSTIEDKTARQLKQEIAKKLAQYALSLKAGEK